MRHFHYSDSLTERSCMIIWIMKKDIIEHENKAVFTLNVDYAQRKYNSGHHSPFNFIQFYKMAPYRVATTIIITTLEARREPRIASENRR